MKFFVCILSVLIIVGTSPPVSAQGGCTERADVVRHLAQKFSEAPIATGLSVNGGVIEILTSEDGRSWTIIITMPNGNSCLVAAGKHWESVVETAKLGPGL